MGLSSPAIPLYSHPDLIPMPDNLLTREAFVALAKERSPHALSFYLPVHRTGREVQQDTLRLRNMLRDAEEALAARGLRRPEADKLLAKVRELLDHQPFWEDQKDGLAIFASPDAFVTLSLPMAFEEQLLAADHFHLTPLLSLLYTSKEFYVLAVSEKSVRLLRGSERTMHDIFVDIFPGPRGALREQKQEKTMQRHTVSAPSGGRYAVFHGQGAFKDAQDDEILEYLRAVNARFLPLLKGQSAPLVFVGGEKLFGHFRATNSYPHLLPEHVEGSPDRWSETEIHKRVWPLVAKTIEESLENAVAEAVELLGGNRVSDDLRTILPRAAAGKVTRLYLCKEARQPGIYDEKRATLELHEEPAEGDEDLLDLAAIHTLLHGGQIYALDHGKIPVESNLLAILRP